MKEVLKAFEEIKEEIQSLKVREDEVAKLLEDNLIIIGKLYVTVDDSYKSLINSLQVQ